MADDSLAGLSEAHKRGIRATLVFVDEALCEIQQWAEGREQHSELYREHNTLSPNQRRLLMEELERMRRVLADLRDALGLEVEVRNAEAAVHSLACSLWPHLAELKGKHLKRYGHASSAAIEKLAPSVDELIAGVQRMAEIARIG